ncbi:hypothetical protein PSPO01_09830 [Paraphaeosphaeria sporulosa]
MDDCLDPVIRRLRHGFTHNLEGFNGEKIPGSEFLIPALKRPSLLDVEFVKKFYPWDEVRYQKYQRNKKDPGSKS